MSPMNISHMKKDEMLLNELSDFGDGVLAYIKPISIDYARDIVGEIDGLPNDMELFCLFSANGTPLAISDSHETAFDSAIEHDLKPTRLH